jgi:hypothetical protein
MDAFVTGGCLELAFIGPMLSVQRKDVILHRLQHNRPKSNK